MSLQSANLASPFLFLNAAMPNSSAFSSVNAIFRNNQIRREILTPQWKSDYILLHHWNLLEKLQHDLNN